MKKLLVLPLVILAAGCGSQTGASSTVTSPPKTVKVQPTADEKLAQSSCKMAMEMLIKMESKTLDAAQLELHFHYAKGTKLINQVDHQIDVVKPLVNLCRMS